MADLHRTIDRSHPHLALGGGRAPAPRARRRRALHRTGSHGAGELLRGVRGAQDAVRVRPPVVGIRHRCGAALRAVLGHPAPARQPVGRARGRGQAAGPRLSLRAHRRRAGLRASGQLRAGAHRAAARDRGRRREAAVRHRRPARGTRARHRRIQGGFRGRRRVGARGIRCTSSSSFRIRCRGRRSPTSPMPRRSSSASSPSGIRRARSRSSSATARAGGR